MKTAIAFALIVVASHFAPRRMCGDRRWMRFEYDYAEWVCQQPRGHSGDHSGWLPR